MSTCLVTRINSIGCFACFCSFGLGIVVLSGCVVSRSPHEAPARAALGNPEDSTPAPGALGEEGEPYIPIDELPWEHGDYEDYYRPFLSDKGAEILFDGYRPVTEHAENYHRILADLEKGRVPFFSIELAYSGLFSGAYLVIGPRNERGGDEPTWSKLLSELQEQLDPERFRAFRIESAIRWKSIEDYVGDRISPEITPGGGIGAMFLSFHRADGSALKGAWMLPAPSIPERWDGFFYFPRGADRAEREEIMKKDLAEFNTMYVYLDILRFIGVHAEYDLFGLRDSGLPILKSFLNGEDQ